MPSKKPAGSSTKRTLEEECPKYEDKIKEAVGSQVGEDSIWCDGLSLAARLSPHPPTEGETLVKCL